MPIHPTFWSTQFIKGREEIKAFLRRKWAKELDYALMKVGGYMYCSGAGFSSRSDPAKRRRPRSMHMIDPNNDESCIQQELWAFSGNRISARFEYEWHDGKGQWYRSHGNEQWQFDDKGAFGWWSQSCLT